MRGICHVQALKNKSFSFISLVCLWNTALIVRNGHNDDSRLSLFIPGKVDSRRKGCRFGCVAAAVVGVIVVAAAAGTTVGCTGIDIGNEGDWLRTNGGGHCWCTNAIDARLADEWWARNGVSCKLLSDALFKDRQKRNEMKILGSFQ